MSNLRDIETIERRLQDWLIEKRVNLYGMARFADRAIRLLEADLEHAKAIEARSAETPKSGSARRAKARSRSDLPKGGDL